MRITTTQPEQFSFDLLVVGGGLAGVGAAVAAARGGASVALVQDRPVLGGNASSEVRIGLSGASNSNAWARETGVIEEILLETGVGTSLSDVRLREFVLREPTLALFLNTSVRGVAMDGARIAQVAASQLGSEREFLFTVRQVIDCTGDGTVGSLAGADWRSGREARAEYDEPLAPLAADLWMMGNTVLLRARNTGRPIPFTAPTWVHYYATEDEVGVYRWLGAAQGETVNGWWWMEIGMPPFDTIRDNEAITYELHRRALGVWDFFKNRFRDTASYAQYELEWIGMVPGKRESRRLLGDVVLSELDCHHDRAWPDVVAYGGGYLDLHTSGGVLNPAEPAEYAQIDGTYANWAKVAPYGIPLRALYSRNVENLWMAGRNLSATHVALGSTRVMLTTACLGQATGTAAAYALAHHLAPRQAAELPHITEIQRRLLRDDARLLGRLREEPNDLARTATVSASSSAVLDLERLTAGDAPLDLPRAVILPISGPVIERLGICLTAEAPCTVQVELQRVRTLWDREPGETTWHGTLAVETAERRWTEAQADLPVEPGLYRLILHPVPGVRWHGAEQAMGTVAQFLAASPGGCDPLNRHWPRFDPVECAIPPYALWVQQAHAALAVRLAPASRPYTAANVVNGCDWPEAWPNLWISGDGLPQWLQWTWPAPRTIARAELRFDSDLHAPLRNPAALPAALATDWELQALDGERWNTVYRDTANRFRKREVTFPPVTTTAVRLVIYATAGGTTARIYAVRWHGEEHSRLNDVQ
jgi:hypothetical protein